MKALPACAAIALLVLSLAGANTLARVPVVATFTILGDWVTEVGGDRVSVKTLVGADSDAHAYEPRPADVRQVASARAVFVNGRGFEGWLKRLVNAAGSNAAVIVTSEGVTTLGDDPHAWLNVSNAIVYVRNIAAGLCRVDPPGCAAYQANAGTYTARLAALDAEIRATLAPIAPARRTVISAHDAFGHYGAAYGMRFLAPIGMSGGAQASAAGLARLIDQIRSTDVHGLFLENVTDRRLIEQIARETGLEPGGALYADALSGPGGPGATYIDMMRHNTRTLARGVARDRD